MNNTILLEQPKFEGMFNTISCGFLLEAASRYTINKLNKSRKEEMRNTVSFEDIKVPEFLGRKNIKINVFAHRDYLEKGIADKDIVAALNYFSNNIEEMQDVAMTALYDHYDHNRVKESPKAYAWLSRVMNKKYAKDIAYYEIDKYDFEELMLGCIDYLYVTDEGEMVMGLYTVWETPVMVTFYDVKHRKPYKPYKIIIDYYSL